MLSIQDLVNKAVRSGGGGGGGGTLHRGAAADPTAGACESSGNAGDAPAHRPAILERSRHDAPGMPPKDIGGMSACACGDLGAARRLRGGGWDPQAAVDKHGNTPLMWAAGAGHLEVVQWLVEEERVQVLESNKQGRTALMWAAKNGQQRVCEWLLQEAPEPRVSVDAQMKDGSRAWDWAVYGGHLPTLALLAAHPGVDKHGRNNFGCGAAFWAAAAGNVTTCQWLYELGIDFALVNDAGHTSVHKAAWKGHHECLKWMICDDKGPKLVLSLLALLAQK